MRADGKILKKIAIFCVLAFGATSEPVPASENMNERSRASPP
jgi:hypothetical protein